VASPQAALRLGTRGSKLALTQSQMVVHMLAKVLKRDIELVIIKTEGDENQGSLMHPIRPGVFVSAIRDALLAGEVDLIVHSMKDLPSASMLGLHLVAIPTREDYRDVIVSRSGLGLMQLPVGASVGTSSPRRAARINFLRPDLETKPIRGNVDSRIQKVHDGEFDAVVLAAAGLKRLGRINEVTEYLTADQLLPAPAQGALAIEIRNGDRDLTKTLEKLDDKLTRTIVTAERAVLVGLGASCRTAVGSLASLNKNTLTLIAELSDATNNEHERVEMSIELTNADAVGEAIQLGMLVAEQLAATNVGKRLAEND
jgi:hydroxymethylbilane synthase